MKLGGITLTERQQLAIAMLEVSIEECRLDQEVNGYTASARDAIGAAFEKALEIVEIPDNHRLVGAVLELVDGNYAARIKRQKSNPE